MMMTPTLSVSQVENDAQCAVFKFYQFGFQLLFLLIA